MKSIQKQHFYKKSLVEEFKLIKNFDIVKIVFTL